MSSKEKKPYLQIPNSTETSPVKNSTPPSRNDSIVAQNQPQMDQNSANRETSDQNQAALNALRANYAAAVKRESNNQENGVNRKMQEDLALLKRKYPTMKAKIISHVWKHKKGNLRLIQEFLSSINPETHRSFFEENPAPQIATSTTTAKPVSRLSSLSSTPLSLDKYKLNPAKKTLTIQQKFGIKPIFSSPEKQPVKRRKLVRGSRNPKPDYSEELKLEEEELLSTKVEVNSSDTKLMRPKRVAARAVLNLSDDDDEIEAGASDSGSDSDADVAPQNGSQIDFQLNARLLQFLNTADIDDISDIGGCSPDMAQKLVQNRPYMSLYALENDDLTENPAQVARSGRGGVRKLNGLKIVERAAVTLRGYDAVESLVQKCSEYGSIIAKEIGKWGVQVTGEQGELEMTEVGELKQEDVEAKQEDDDEEKVVVKKKQDLGTYFTEKPQLLSPDLVLKPYQQVGINWLSLLYDNNLSCILADEMGLGKTCQVISFFAHLKQVKQDSGRHLVIVPSSTLENWLREFQKFCPALKVSPYYGSQKERAQFRYDLQETEFDILVTTYNLATGQKDDMKFLRSQNFNVIVYDEGHMLKNSASDRYQKLMRIKARFRLLLTGTPLQNNLKELISLLAFILPDLFNQKKEDLQILFNQKVTTGAKFKDKQAKDKESKDSRGYNPLLSVRAISRAKTMMTPFVLRRKKQQVMKNLPKKIVSIEYCDNTDSQRKLYEGEIAKARKISNDKQRDQSSNIIMSLRKAAIHPLLFRVHYNNKMLKSMAKDIMAEPQYREANQQFIYEDMEVMNDYELHNLCCKFANSIGKYQLDLQASIVDSGKFLKMQQLLPQFIIDGDRILLFSLFTQVLDLFEVLLSNLNIKFLRLDGQTPVDMRQDIIDQFYQDESIKVFILSTKAGGFGINLACANRVIILDQSFNPHDDRQAEDRAHRVGQTRDVKVVRMISRKTIEENIYALAQKKLALDQSVSGEDGAQDVGKIETHLFKDILKG